ncbi:hypothetical protein MRB53_039460 [Persea americana]|nr:hypothetical protein MRB53_039460 [Persea americana]
MAHEKRGGEVIGLGGRRSVATLGLLLAATSITARDSLPSSDRIAGDKQSTCWLLRRSPGKKEREAYLLSACVSSNPQNLAAPRSVIVLYPLASLTGLNCTLLITATDRERVKSVFFCCRAESRPQHFLKVRNAGCFCRTSALCSPRDTRRAFAPPFTSIVLSTLHHKVEKHLHPESRLPSITPYRQWFRLLRPRVR